MKQKHLHKSVSYPRGFVSFHFDAAKRHWRRHTPK